MKVWWQRISVGILWALCLEIWYCRGLLQVVASVSLPCGAGTTHTLLWTDVCVCIPVVLPVVNWVCVWSGFISYIFSVSVMYCLCVLRMTSFSSSSSELSWSLGMFVLVFLWELCPSVCVCHLLLFPTSPCCLSGKAIIQGPSCLWNVTSTSVCWTWCAAMHLSSCWASCRPPSTTD